MKQILTEIMEKGCYADIYVERNRTSSFNYCRVIGVDDNFFAVWQIDPDGRDDGYSVYPLDRPYRIDCDGSYSEMMSRLMEGQPHEEPIILPDGSDVMLEMLKIAEKDGRIVVAELVDSGVFDITGKITSLADGICRFYVCEDYGTPDGTAAVGISDITRLAFGEAEERRIERLIRR